MELLLYAGFVPVYSSVSEEWFWEFWYTSKTDYERVKMCIMDIASECDSFAETLNTLNEVFLEYFDDMLIFEEEEKCQCENGSCSKHLN